ncbi:MAG: DUF3014 domain-containing protein [Steroidobacterales bacterium]
MQKPIWWGAGAVIVISAAVLFFSWRAHRQTPPPAAATTVAPEPAVPAIRNPLPEVPSTAAPLPALDESDTAIHDALADLMGKPTVDRIFKPELLVRHIVVSIDNLSRRHMAVELRPTKPLAGAFIATGNDQQGTIDTANYQRYVPYVQAVQALDMKRLAPIYLRFYPLFQQAYQSLGYPNGYFNDRLVVTIDNLLATPDITTDISLVRPNVMYQFADPKLEELSAGQKLLLRMGPANAAIIKAKLRELRAQIAERARDTDRSRDATTSAAGASSGSSSGGR